MKLLLIILTLSVVITSQVFADYGGYSQDQKRPAPAGPRRQLATIVFAGLGGAVLGLSTLSFYGRPQDNLGNIAIGFAAGVIAGTVYVTFKSATSRDYMDENDAPKQPYGLRLSPSVFSNNSAPVLGGLLSTRF